MNLFDYYNKPKELHNYKKAHNIVPELVKPHVLAMDDLNDDQMNTIENDPKLALLYSQYFHTKWPESSKGEQSIAGNPTLALRYAADHGKWKEDSLGHKSVTSNPHIAVAYAVAHGKWPEGSKAEEMVASHPQSADRYAQRYGAWPKGSTGENSIAEEPVLAVRHARTTGKRWPEGSAAEKKIAKHMLAAFNYATNVIRDKWPPGEDAIKKDSTYRHTYNNMLIGKGYSNSELI